MICGSDSLSSVEEMSVVDEEGQNVHESLPNMSSRDVTASLDYIRGLLDLSSSAEEIMALLNKMMLPSILSEDGKSITVRVPPTRSDIMHECDIAEDVAIAFGYNNLNIVIPKTNTSAGQQPLNMLSDLLRSEIAFAGYTEVLSFVLVSLVFVGCCMIVINGENSAPERRTTNSSAERKMASALLSVTPRLWTFRSRVQLSSWVC